MKLVLGKGQRRNRRLALSHAHDLKRRRRYKLIRTVIDSVLTIVLGSMALEEIFRKGKLKSELPPETEK